MSAALTWSTLSEYQPPLRVVPPDPDEFDFDDPTVRWHTPPAAIGPAYPLPPPDCPVWDEPGQVRDLIWRLLCVVLEVLDGRRPIDHLRGTLTPAVFESLRTRCHRTAGRQHRLRTLHTCRPAQGALEICGTVAVSFAKHTKAIAIAARVEQRAGR